MKTLKKRVLSFCIMLSLLFAVSVWSADLDPVLTVENFYTVENSRVDIGITGAAPSTSVIKVYKSESELTPASKFVYLAEREFDSKGNAEFFFTMPELKENAPSGEYTIQITQGASNAATTFRHMNKTQALSKIDMLRSCGRENFAAELQNVYGDFGIDIAEFNAYPIDITNLIYRFADMSNIDIYDFWYTYHACVLLSQLQGQENAVIKPEVNNNKKLLKINEEIFALFDEKIEAEFCERISGGAYTQSTLENQIKEWMILSVINSADIYTKVQNVVENNNTFIGIDLTEYNSLNNKEKIVKDFMNTSTNYNTLTAVATAFKNSIDSNKAEGKDTTPSNAGGGGGGGPSEVTKEEIPPVVEAVSKSFTDVPEKHWAHKYINTLSQQGKINGVGQNLFEPERNITRAEFVKLIAAQFFADEEASLSSFVDVKASDWYYSYVAKLEKYGVLMGDGKGSFNPNSYITRQDAVVMIKRAADSCGKNYSGFGNSEGFSDNDKISFYAQNAVKWACAANIINGMPDGTFAPLNLLTRAETAKLIYNLQP